MPAPAGPSALKRFVDELRHFFALMLWVASALAFVARLPQLGVAIIAVILLNALFSFLQERRADRAAERLRALLPHRVTVRRDGQSRDIDGREVVTGDVLVLGSGDRIPADAIADAAHALLIDTSLLTGDSISSTTASTESAIVRPAGGRARLPRPGRSTANAGASR